MKKKKKGFLRWIFNFRELINTITRATNIICYEFVGFNQDDWKMIL